MGQYNLFFKLHNVNINIRHISLTHLYLPAQAFSKKSGSNDGPSCPPPPKSGYAYWRPIKSLRQNPLSKEARPPPPWFQVIRNPRFAFWRPTKGLRKLPPAVVDDFRSEDPDTPASKRRDYYWRVPKDKKPIISKSRADRVGASPMEAYVSNLSQPYVSPQVPEKFRKVESKEAIRKKDMLHPINTDGMIECGHFIPSKGIYPNNRKYKKLMKWQSYFIAKQQKGIKVWRMRPILDNFLYYSLMFSCFCGLCIFFEQMWEMNIPEDERPSHPFLPFIACISAVVVFFNTFNARPKNKCSKISKNLQGMSASCKKKMKEEKEMVKKFMVNLGALGLWLKSTSESLGVMSKDEEEIPAEDMIGQELGDEADALPSLDETEDEEPIE